MTWEVLCVNVSFLSQFLTALNSGNSSSTRVRKEKHQIGGLLRHRNRKMALLSIKTFDDSWEKNEKCYFSTSTSAVALTAVCFGVRRRENWVISYVFFFLVRKLENSISITFSFLCFFTFFSKSFLMVLQEKVFSSSPFMCGAGEMLQRMFSSTTWDTE